MSVSISPKILDGNRLANQLKQSYLPRVAKLQNLGIEPCLAVIIVGADPASEVYVRNKIADCQAVGIRSLHFPLSASSSSEEVLDIITQLNQRNDVHGILLQLPLPQHIDPQPLLEAINVNKDVDAFHPQNSGALLQGNPRFLPCTPHGVMKMLEAAEINLSGLNAVVIGRSNIVGKPMALLLLAAGCTVTICHSKTKDLRQHLARADLVVAAVGIAKMITGDMLKQGVVVIDVGINRLSEGSEMGKLCGDVDYASVLSKVSAITPVPGGVGPMTRAMLLENTLLAAEAASHIR